MVHADEAIEPAAQRALSDEVSYRASRLTYLRSYHMSKSIMDDTAHLFLGTELVILALPSDETEFIEVHPFSFAEALRMVQAGKIVDGMTIIGVLQAADLRTHAEQLSERAALEE